MRVFRTAAGLLVIALAVTFLVMTGAERYQAVLGPVGGPEGAPDIVVPPEYQLELVARGLSFPTQVTFDERGELYVVESGGRGEGVARLVKLAPDGSLKPVATGFTPPFIGAVVTKGRIYASHRGRLTVIEPNGSRRDLVSGLPSLGDHTNNFPVLSPDGWIYFGQGTATNSGVVGLDNLAWLGRYPGMHDRPATDVVLVGHNFTTANPLLKDTPVVASTGAYSPFGMPTVPGQVVRGSTKPNGAVYRIRPDGTGLEVVAWGFRNPYGMAFDRQGHLWVYNHGYDDRGSRPVGNAPDELHQVRSGSWYGFPDFAAGEPLAQPKYKPDLGPAPQTLLKNHPSAPPKPAAVLPPHSAGGAFDFAPAKFGHRDEVFIPLLGPVDPRLGDGRKLGAKIVRVNGAGQVFDFAVNRIPGPASLTGAAGFERPSCVRFGPDGALYVTDFGVIKMGQKGPELVPNTGTLWRIARRSAQPATAPAARRTTPFDAFAPLGPVGTFVLGGLFGALFGASLQATLRRRRR